MEKKLKNTVTLQQHDRLRDVFLVGCYTGSRFSDYAKFETLDIQDNFIGVTTQKTKTPVYIPIHQKLRIILDKYNGSFPLFPFQIGSFSKYLKAIFKKAGFTDEVKITELRGTQKTTIIKKRYQLIGTHTARRTFITISHKKGIPDKIIMQVAGIKSVDTLHRYIRINKDDISEAMKAWD